MASAFILDGDHQQANELIMQAIQRSQEQHQPSLLVYAKLALEVNQVSGTCQLHQHPRGKRQLSRMCMCVLCQLLCATRCTADICGYLSTSESYSDRPAER